MTNYKTFFTLLISIGFLITVAQASPDGGKNPKEDPPGFKFNTVVIDAGHGGKDPGAHGSFSFEKNVCLSIATKLQQALRANMPQLKVIMTRSTNTFIPLNRRAEIANENKGNLFISIHCNSSPERRTLKGKGVLLLVYGYHRKQEQMEALRENAVIYQEKDYVEKYHYDPNDPTGLIVLNAFMQRYRKQSIRFADLLNTEFKEKDNRHSLGVKEQGVLILAHSAMPSVLIETGFINNPEEERYLNSDSGQYQIVQTIIRAIQKYQAAF